MGRAAEFGAWLVEGSAGWGAEPGQVWPSCCMQAAVVGLVVLLGLGCIVLLIGCLVSGAGLIAWKSLTSVHAAPCEQGP